MNITIRKAEERDLQGILDLVTGLAIYEKEPEAVTSTIADYERAFNEDLIDAHLAFDGEELVGMALYFMAFSTWKGHNLWLEDFFVQEEYRSTGIGQQLFDKYIEEAKKRSCKMVKWEVLDWNLKAVKFYNRNGATIEKNWWDCKIIF